jgi:hypothetical protein
LLVEEGQRIVLIPHQHHQPTNGTSLRIFVTISNSKWNYKIGMMENVSVPSIIDSVNSCDVTIKRYDIQLHSKHILRVYIYIYVCSFCPP